MTSKYTKCEHDHREHKNGEHHYGEKQHPFKEVIITTFEELEYKLTEQPDMGIFANGIYTEEILEKIKIQSLIESQFLPYKVNTQEIEKWNNFLALVAHLDDPLLNSLLKKGSFSGFNAETCTVSVSFSKELIFFNEWLNNTRDLWYPLLKNIFGELVIFNPIFITDD